MAILSTVKSFSASVSWDSAWANRSGSGSGYLWKVIPSYGVNIMDKRSLNTNIEFRSAGDYTVEFYVSDGAVCSKTTKAVKIDPQNDYSADSGGIDVTLFNDKDLVVPLHLTLPKGTAIFRELDCFLDVDYSGSMQDTMDNLKVYINEIVTALFEGADDVRCAIGRFGCSDGDDEYFNDYYEVQLKTDMTADMEILQAAVDGLYADSTGCEELQFFSIYVNANADEVNKDKIKDIYNKCPVSWREKSLRVYVIFTDEPPNDVVATSTDASDTLLRNNIKLIVMDCCASSTDNNPYVGASLRNMANMTGGQLYCIGSTTSTKLVESIKAAVTQMTTNLTVKMTPVGMPNGLVKSITPSQHTGVNPGDSFEFQITFNRSGLPPGSGVQTFKFNLEVIAADIALVDTIPVNVTVKWS